MIRDDRSHCVFILFLLCASVLSLQVPSSAQTKKLPEKVPPKRTSQIEDGFGINSDLPRDPYLPWNRWWWTRMFDAGFKWIRIGQYENSSDSTSWDWVEQKRGVYTSSQLLEDYVDSLIDNGMKVQVQLMYGNPMYTAHSGKLPESACPRRGAFTTMTAASTPSSGHLLTPEQHGGFQPVRQMDGEPLQRPHPLLGIVERAGHRLLESLGQSRAIRTAARSVRRHRAQNDPAAKVIYGGQADPSREFTQVALDTCKCARGIDVYAYHTYPGYGQNMNPETMDYGAYLNESPQKLRDLVNELPWD